MKKNLSDYFVALSVIVIALLAIYVRATCPESPYWVRAQDRKQRIAENLVRGRRGQRWRRSPWGRRRRRSQGAAIS